MKCPYCGNEHEDDREYCPETGDRIEHCNLGEFLYLICKAEGGYKILDMDGRPVSPLETIIEVDYRLAAYDQSKMPPYILGFNSADENLYFISPKQIICLADWKNGKVSPLGSSRFPTSCPWYLHEYHYEKEVVLEDDFKSFYIIDKYDYKTYYWVENGNCLSAPKKRTLPYVFDPYESIPVSVSASTGETVVIPGFKANVYLGNEGGKDIFWAARRCSSGQLRFKESFIVDIDGNILRQYEYHAALPLMGKYILNTYNGHLRSVSKLNGEILYTCKFDTSDILLSDYVEIAPDVFRFGIEYSDDFWYWLVNENIFCTWYNKDFYIIPNDKGDKCLYRRTDNGLIGAIPSWDNISGLEFGDNVYYAEFRRNFKRCFFNSSGESIYNLEDNEFPLCTSDDPDIFCGAAENRIIVNVDNRYFKILDYSGKEIARVDFTGRADHYQSGRFYYFNETELGYYDYDGVKHLVQYETRKWIKDIKVISSDRLFVKHNNKEVIIDSEGKILIEAISICLEPFGRYFQAFDENYRSYIYDGSCQMLSPLDPGDRVLIME